MVKKVVTPSNLNPEHFKIDREAKLIDVIFPADAGIRDIGLEGTNLNITQANGETKQVDLSPAIIAKDSAVQSGSLEGTNLNLVVNDPNADGGTRTVTINVANLINGLLKNGQAKITLNEQLTDAFDEPLGFISTTADVTVVANA
ncbi:hypothetical protein [Taylorella asinigenitalis]|uniref:Putative phage protein n=1 Tax=Taylorella asinigenitalis (strain MCE3) TaxID=1008459 RepID=G4QCU2_TAYAM|nr:hypothetical protein [Taylorella asinigenitalis]AEP36222.1 putative phage protein [Taylorella asinigenitalis MCE3]